MRRLAAAGLFCGTFLLVSAGNYGKGIFYYDEGFNLLEARFVQESFAKTAGYFSHGGDATFREYIRDAGKPGGLYLSYGKPLHTLILALGLILSGGAAWGAYAMIAIAASALVALTFLTGARLGGAALGLAAAALLATSGYFLNYARETLAEMDAALFYLAAIYVCLPAWNCGRGTVRARRRLLAGLLSGLAFSCNYRWFWIPLALAAMEILCWRNMRRGAQEAAGYSLLARRAAALAAGFAAALAAFEAPFRLAAFYFRGEGLALPFETYFEQLARLYFTQSTAEKGFDLAGPQTYWVLLWRLGHPLTLLLLAAAAPGLARFRRSPGRLLLLIHIAGPMLFYSFYTFKFARFLSLSLPFFALAQARGLNALLRVRRKRPIVRRPMRWLQASAIAIVAAAQLHWAREVFTLRSPYAQAHADLAAMGAARYWSTEKYISGWHAGVENTDFPPRTWAEMEEKSRQGWRYVLVGPMAGYWGELESLRRLSEEFEPVKTYPNSSGEYFLFHFEHARDYRSAASGDRFPEAGVVQLYRLPF